MDRQSLQQHYPLSPLQQGMLFHYLRAPEAGIDIEQIVCTLREHVDPSLLRQAWGHVVNRHVVLRTSFRWKEEAEPFQVVQEDVELPWKELDWREVSPSEQVDRLATFLADDRHRGFNMSQAPLLRLTLIHHAPAELQLVWTFHHALLDGRSFPLLLNEVFAFYQSLTTGGRFAELPAPRPYRDHIEWLGAQDQRVSEAYWREQLKGFSTPTPLVVDRTCPPQSVANRQGDARIILEAETTAALHKFAQNHGLTLNTLVQGAWALLLSRYSGEADIVYGVVRACRKSSVPGADEMVGLFINTLPLRVQVHEDACLVDWLQQLRAQWRAMRDYEHTPLVRVQKCSDVPSGKPVFESILMFENYELDARMKAQGGEWANRSIRLYEQTGYPITLTVYSGDRLCLQIEFDRSRFDASTISRMLSHLKSLLEGMLAGAEQRLRDLPLLTKEELHQVVVGWNDTQRQYPKDALLHQFFEAQVERTPTAVAVTYDKQQLTYRQLNDRANQLAHYLLRLGAGPDTMVGVCMERSLELVVALYGVLKAGSAYVPIDPEYPQERVAFMLQDAAPPVLLTQSHIEQSLPNHEGKAVCLDRDWDEIAREDSGNPVVAMNASQLAYMIYTSGSTGRPKGAMNTHRGICNRLLWMQDQYGLTQADKVLQKTPFSFDVSVWEFFWPLLVGAQLVVARPGGHRDATYLTRLINEQKITVLHFVPSMLRIFLEETAVGTCTSLRHVICSGEALPVDLQEPFFASLPAQLHNLYGPTEAAVDVTHWTCRRGDPRHTVPIGRPVANTQVYVLDRHMRPLPIGVPGELYLGGVQIGRGYHNRPELTTERFVPDPFSSVPDARLYRTGDLCRWLKDGAVEYLGRLDFQIKIRGLRVELGEIEAALAANPLVKACVVSARENGTADKQLVAYVVWQASAIPSPQSLRNYLRKRLPDYMVPAKFVGLSELPLSPNGKIDQRALPSPSEEPVAADGVGCTALTTETEQKIARIWQEILQVTRVGGTDNFFDLGGDSLRLMRVRNQLQRIFGREVPIVDMFQCTTVQALAQYMNGRPEVTTLQPGSDDRVEARREAARRRLQLRQQTRVS